ncbi:MAG: hypothetical protein A2Y88_11180 [Chloroflexi bacterium RBG_13_48_10]|nr:MAG: hypothetical protein A2Y88_11180 [Chloroflexi bacterium RBG_13_48_10]
MLKKIIVASIFITIIGVLVFGAVNRSLAKVNGESESLYENSYGSIVVNSDNDLPTGKNDSSQEEETNHSNEVINLPPVSKDGLSESEVAGLLYMREEEKLAHDVYSVFYSLNGTQNFQNISQSELTHTEAVKTLIDRYGLTDPASSEMGVFTHPDLQALYNELIALGSQSLADALMVGAAIEEIDILDLQEYLAQTDNEDIQIVYENLLLGSENHLRAFVAKYFNETGVTYAPQYLSLDAFQAIINADTQVGGGSNLGVGGGNGGYRKGKP